MVENMIHFFKKCYIEKNSINISIELPNIIEQEKISKFISILSDKINQEEKKITELNNLKKGLLQKMFI